jgi:hypothetical protein
MEKLGQVTTDALNAAFAGQMESPEGRKELTEKTLLYIKQMLREESFTRKILPPESVTKYDLQRDVQTDTVVKVVDIEPDSRAVALNFRGEANYSFVTGKRFAIPFFTISSQFYEKTEQELFAYEMPVIKVIEENSVKDIQEVEDVTWIRFCQAAVTATGKLLPVGASPSLTTTLLKDGFKMIDGDRLITTVMLMNSQTWDDILAFGLNVFGDQVASKVIVDGYTYDQLLGKKLIVTTKTKTTPVQGIPGKILVPFGQVWFFTDPQYLGRFYLLNSTKLYMDKIAEVIRWKAWETVGIGMGNIKSVAKLEYGTGVGVVPGT